MLQRTSLVPFLLAVVMLARCQPPSPAFVCTDSLGCVDVAPSDPIRIGVLQVLNGDQKLFGQSGLRSFELALDDRDGKLLGHSIELQTEDSLCSKEGGATAAAKLVANPQIVGILGPSCSGAAETATKLVSGAGLVMVSGTSTAPSLTSVGGEPGLHWQPSFFRTAQNDAHSGRAAATFAFEALGIRKAATLDDGDPYTRGLSTIFQEAFTDLGGQVVLAAAVNKGGADM